MKLFIYLQRLCILDVKLLADSIMELFSQRLGITSIKDTIQVDSMDIELRTGLWNTFYLLYWRDREEFVQNEDPQFQTFVMLIWVIFLKNKVDETPFKTSKILSITKNIFFNYEWYQVYDFIDSIPSYGEGEMETTHRSFIELCNQVLEKELSGYRFVDRTLTPVISPVEIESIEQSLSDTNIMDPVKVHLRRSLELLSDRQFPDYRNSIKESISAVESYCKIVTGDPKALLGSALIEISRGTNIHPALRKSLKSLYGYTSDEGGIRHALLEQDFLDQEDAKFMLVSCSAFVNYLAQKEAKLMK